jgi:hypothetical protein
MSVQLLFYAQATPVSSDRHRDLFVKTGGTYDFAAHVNAVPLMAVEFRAAAQEYPIVFAGEGDALLPVAVLGIARERNLFVDAAGHWQGRYIPAYVRRYPFVFASNDDGSTFTLCIDEGFTGCNRDGRGERLFDADGERTGYLRQVLGFVTEYQAQFQATRGFARRLADLGLLEGMTAQFRLPDGSPGSLSGFQGINRERLKTLAPEQLAMLARSDELELIYLHLQSMQCFQQLTERAGTSPPRQ